VTAPVWADGPSAGFDDDAPMDRESPTIAGATLIDQLMLAQQTAAALRAADTRHRATLYRVLGRAHEFAAAADADPVGYDALLASAGIAVQLRAPMTPIVKLIFGADYDKTRLTEYAAVLAHARRMGVAIGALGDFLDSFEGGIKGVVKAERAARTPNPKARVDRASALANRPTLASVAIESNVAPGDYVLLLARASDGGMLDIVAEIGDDATLTERAMRRMV
jgi:hypothetical protein